MRNKNNFDETYRLELLICGEGVHALDEDEADIEEKQYEI